MKTYVDFRSDLFPAYPGEKEQINPGVWGKRLAEFLYEGFNRHGILASPPISEDWGWVVPIQNKPFSLWVGCGHYQEYADGFLCFVEPSKPFIWRRFKKIPTEATISEITKRWIRCCPRMHPSEKFVGGQNANSTIREPNKPFQRIAAKDAAPAERQRSVE